MKRWRTDGAAGRWLIAAALVLPFLCGRPSAGGEPKAPDAPTFSRAAFERIGDHVRNEVTAGKIPGAVMLIQQHGKPVDLESFGVRDPATSQPMTPDTIFQIYSMSKAITSVAAMMLVDDGKLALDDAVSKYIHAFADAKVGVDPSDEAGQASAQAGAAEAPDHDQGSAAAYLGHHLRLLRRNRRAETLCQSLAVCRRFRQCRVRRPDRGAAARRPARRALELQPFDRRARPCRRGGLGADAVSIREAAAVRSARHVRDHLPSGGSKRSGRASPSRFPPIVSGSPASAIQPCRGGGNPAVRDWSRRPATTPASCRCC